MSLALSLLVAGCDQKQEQKGGGSSAAADDKGSASDKSKNKKSSNSKAKPEKKKASKGGAEDDEGDGKGQDEEGAGADDDGKGEDDERSSKDQDADGDEQAALTACGMLAQLKPEAHEQTLKEACAGAEFSAKAKALMDKPFKTASVALQDTVHFTAKEVGEESELVGHFSALYNASCERFVLEAGPKIMTTPKKVSFFGGSVEETSQKVEDIESNEEYFSGGASYKGQSVVSGFVSKTDTFAFEAKVYSLDGGFVSVERTTTPGKDLHRRSVMTVLLDQKDGTCLSLTALHLKVAHDGRHDTVIDSVLVPGITNAVNLAITEAGKLK